MVRICNVCNPVIPLIDCYFMKPSKFLILLSIMPLFMGCNNKPKPEKSVIKTENIVLTEEVEDVEPPPPGFKTKFKNIQNWLLKICDTDKPAKPIQTYNFGLFESPKENIIYLVGTNTYQEKNHSLIRIEFKPSDMFFRLPDNGFKNLNREQLLDKINSQLKDFTKTEKFKSSLLAKAQLIKTEFKGEFGKTKSPFGYQSSLILILRNETW